MSFYINQRLQCRWECADCSVSGIAAYSYFENRSSKQLQLLTLHFLRSSSTDPPQVCGQSDEQSWTRQSKAFKHTEHSSVYLYMCVQRRLCKLNSIECTGQHVAAR